MYMDQTYTFRDHDRRYIQGILSNLPLHIEPIPILGSLYRPLFPTGINLDSYRFCYNYSIWRILSPAPKKKPPPFT